MRLILVAMLAVLLAACSGGGSGEATRGSLRGLVTDVEVERDSRLVVFSVRSDSGQDMAFQYEAGAPQVLDPAHLREHMDQKLPVTVNYTRTGKSRAVALEILD